MKAYQQFYINGKWVQPSQSQFRDVINPATEQVVGRIALGTEQDIDAAVRAARAAFDSYAATTRDERLDYLQRIAAIYERRYEELAQTVSQEMGAPITLARKAQAATGMAHLMTAINILKDYAFEYPQGDITVVREPIGVCGFITPWNWPLNQISCKVFPALAAGCTMVLKPSEVAPLSAGLFAEILDEAGLPAGVFNLVNGEGPVAGAALSAHPEVDMMSFTGSTRAGVKIAKSAADTIKRVSQELGGKSANILLDDVELEKAVSGGVRSMMNNSGQSCNAPSRMLVPRALYEQAVNIAREVASSIQPGDTTDENTVMGPLASEIQYRKVSALIQKGVEEGARLVCGGAERPAGLDKGYYVKPTIFADVNNSMTIAREEIFGPVLCLIPYGDEDEAVRIANDTPYGLAGYVSGSDPERVRRVARRIRAGAILLNGSGPDFTAPFGGYKQSGNGREWGVWGLEEFLETKALVGD